MTTASSSKLFGFFLNRPKLVATICLMPSLAYVAYGVNSHFRKWKEEKILLNGFLFGVKEIQRRIGSGEEVSDAEFHVHWDNFNKSEHWNYGKHDEITDETWDETVDLIKYHRH